jgi:adenylate cyclase
MSQGREIERKYQVKRLPDGLDDGAPMVQRYLAVDGDTQVRLRRKGDRRLLTVKAGGGMNHAEEELELDSERFDRLWPLAAGREIRKVRYEVALGDGLVAELDVFEGHLDGMVCVEVEFPSDHAADSFTPPDWFGPEVTGDPQWANVALAAAVAPPEPFTGS